MNTYNTGRLDMRTESEELAEKPKIKLTLTRGFLKITDESFQINFQWKVIVTTTPAPGGRSCQPSPTSSSAALLRTAPPPPPPPCCKNRASKENCAGQAGL